MVYAYN